MYKVICSYDKEKVVKKNKATLKKSLVVSVVLAFLLVAVGVWNIVFALTENKINWLSLVVGVFACLFSAVPIFNAIKTSNRETENVVKQMGVDKDVLNIEYVFKDRRIEVKKEQGEKVELDTIMFKNVTTLKKSKDGFAFIMQDGTTYFFDNEDIVEGTEQQIVALFSKNGISIKRG